jgi:hypothetical protein
MSEPWWLRPKVIVPIPTDKKISNLEEKIDKLLASNKIERFNSYNGEAMSHIFSGGISCIPATQFESMHAYVSSSEKQLAASYTLDMYGILDSCISNIRLRIDSHVKSVFISVGNIKIWETHLADKKEDITELVIGNISSVIPTMLLSYMKVSIVVLTDHESRNALYDSSYELKYDLVLFPFPDIDELRQETLFWSGYKVYIRDGMITEKI